MASKTYQQLQKEIADLQRQAEEVRQQELATVIAEIKSKIAEFGLSSADLFGSTRSRSTKPGASSSVAAKYRDPDSNAVWSGRGRTPKWLEAHEAAGRKRDGFLVRQAS